MSVKMCNHRWPRNAEGECHLQLDDLHETPLKELRYHMEDYRQQYSRQVFAWDGRGETQYKEEYARVHGNLFCDKTLATICPFRFHRVRGPYERKYSPLEKCPWCGEMHYPESNARKLCESWHKASEIFKALKFKNITWLPEGSREDPYGHTFDDMSMAKASLWNWIRDAVLERDEHRCQICKRQSEKAIGWWNKKEYFTEQVGVDSLEVHHIIPRFEGGTEHPANLMTVCTSCHSKLTGEMLSNLASVRNFMEATARGQPIEVEETEEQIIANKFGKGKELFEEVIGIGGRS